MITPPSGLDRSAPPIPASDPLLAVENLVKEFPVRRGFLRRQVGAVSAVADVSFTLGSGETLGVVGESGCGKSTLARVIVGLHEATSGDVRFNGRSLTGLRGAARREIKKQVQLVFQDPYASLNPRMRVKDIIAEPLRIHGVDDMSRVRELMSLVRLPEADMNRYPGEFSGGQRQRIGIARSIALHPRLLILDEPVSALDVSIQAQVINLLQDLQEELGLSYVFVAHDLAVVRQLAHRVAVMYLGKVVEVGSAEQIYSEPRHPYTQALLSAVPDVERHEGSAGRIILRGDLPSPAAPPSGCRFRTRCWKAEDICSREEPGLDSGDDPAHSVACHFPGLPGRPGPDRPTHQLGKVT